jgi:hypothetical protein
MWAQKPVKPLVPADFKVPTDVKILGDYKLIPLGPALTKIDYEAYMSSLEHLRTTFGGGKWPRADIQMKEAEEDMAFEKGQWDTRASFPYALVTADGKKELGCVYIRPSKNPAYEAQVRLWVTKAEFDKGLHKELWPKVKQWVKSDWPFTKVEFKE